MNKEHKRIAIIGGGISGLATAFYLSRAAEKTGIPVSITLFESQNRLGGTILTSKENGFLIEAGPDSFVTIKPWGLALCRELGIENRLIPTNPQNRKVYVFSNGRLEELPVGMFLTVPTRLFPFLKSRLISPLGKLRMAMDLFLPRGARQSDESLGAFVRRRFGREALEKIAEPLMGGIYVTEAERLSLQATFPQLLEVERKHRSLILGMLRQGRRPAPSSMFLTPKEGMQELVTALTSRMPSVIIQTNCKVEKLERRGTIYHLILSDQSTLNADEVVLTCPAPQAAVLARGISEELSHAISKIKYTSSATVSFGFAKRAIPHTLDASGFIVPRREGRKIVACTWASSKFEGRAPEGYVLLRCFLCEAWDKSFLSLDGKGIAELAREELRRILGITEPPVLAKCFRWYETNPLYEVGHAEHVQEIERKLEQLLGLYVTGAAYRGVGIPDCIHDAAQIASRILKQRTVNMRQ